MTLSEESVRAWADRVAIVGSRQAVRSPGDGPERQPVHVVYGGAHLFSANTATRLGELATAHMQRWLPDAAALAAITGMDETLAPRVYERVVAKLDHEPVEDFRLDFEDGYGHRPEPEEDGHAESSAQEVAAGMEAGSLPPYIGVRIKSLTPELFRRSLRTLDLFVSALVTEAGSLPSGFVVTLPKIQDSDQVTILVEALAEMEASLDIAPIPIELMVETPETVIAADATAGLRTFVEAGQGRVRGAHFGTYDYTASMNITATHQSMDHPACDFARHVLQASLAGSGIWLSDGATNVMPIPAHRGDDLTSEQERENEEVVNRVMRLHYDHVRSSLVHAYYQGWDLHPAQLPTRYAALYAFFMEGLDAAGARLSNFVESAAKATLVGEVFDDAATGQGLLNYFLRAINCGAISEEEALARSSLTIEELRSRSFLTILQGRKS